MRLVTEANVQAARLWRVAAQQKKATAECKIIALCRAVLMDSNSDGG